MVKVFTTVPGARLWIDGAGEATNDSPAIVSEAVAAQLEAELAGKPEVPEIPANDETGEPGRPAQPAIAGRTDIRVERAQAAEPQAQPARRMRVRDNNPPQDAAASTPQEG